MHGRTRFLAMWLGMHVNKDPATNPLVRMMLQGMEADKTSIPYVSIGVNLGSCR